MKTRKNRWLWPVLILFFLTTLFFYPFRKPTPIHYIERQTGKILTEKVPGGFWLYRLYNNPLGELSLQTLVKRKIVSSFYGNLMDKPSSVKKIKPFIHDYGIDMSIVQKHHFISFNDFFIRKLIPEARPIDTTRNSIVSPADGKVLAWQNIDNQDFIVKGYRFNLLSFLQNDTLATLFSGGSLLLFRLAPVDYHRFHFPVNGKIIGHKKIDGDYYSVSPLAIKKNIRIFCENKREYTLINTTIAGDMLMAEIGATMVGSIVETYTGNKAVKGAEKGYFKFGGSSVLLLFEKGRISIDTDLLKNTQDGLETSIHYGEKVAIATALTR